MDENDSETKHLRVTIQPSLASRDRRERRVSFSPTVAKDVGLTKVIEAMGSGKEQRALGFLRDGAHVCRRLLRAGRRQRVRRLSLSHRQEL